MGRCATNATKRFLLRTAVFLLTWAVMGQFKVAGLFIKHLSVLCAALHANCSSVLMNPAMSVNMEISLKGTGSIKSISGVESIKKCGQHPWSSVLMQPFFYSQNMAPGPLTHIHAFALWFMAEKKNTEELYTVSHGDPLMACRPENDQ